MADPQLAHAATVAPIVPCPTCGAAIPDAYCGACGERRPTPVQLTLRHLAREASEHITSFDGVLVRTLILLVRRPGALTAAYLSGSRTRYARPVQLFVFVNVLFFLAAPHIGLLRYAKQVPPHPTTAVEQARVEHVLQESISGQVASRRMHEHHERWDQFVARYNAVIDARVSAIVGLEFLAPFVALAIVCAGRARYIAAHAVFMLHFATFTLLWQPIAVFAIEPLFRAIGLLHDAGFIATVLLAMLGPLVLYLAVAIRRVYGGSALLAAARAFAVVTAYVLGLRLFAQAVEAVTVWFL